MGKTIMWFRRDLRLTDHPALAQADERATDGVVPLFVLDPALWGPSGPSRRAYLVASLTSLRDRIGGLVLREGDPVDVVPELARQVAAEAVHVSADYGPYGSRRDEAVERALAGDDVEFVRRGSPYAVDPGTVENKSDKPYQVYTPFSRAWAEHGWPGPCPTPKNPGWDTSHRSVAMPTADLPDGLDLPEAGEPAALERWKRFRADGIDSYADDRDRPDLDRTSHLSVHLKWGEIHPRTLLADFEARAKGPKTYRNELAWREFYADVLWQRPDSARDYYRPNFAQMEYAQPGKQFEAWQEGKTGFPIVDAAMRQLRATGWMHNRCRMIVASFLVKDLHIEWQHGARHFMHWLVDGDLASNQHGWQWTAGCGTDAAPYFRIFNPVTQGKKFDPDGDFIRRWVPERADDDASVIHEPRNAIVEHADERDEALRRYNDIKDR